MYGLTDGLFCYVEKWANDIDDSLKWSIQVQDVTFLELYI